MLEVLAATMIFALIFATTLQVLSGSIRNTQRSADYTQAALWAESRLAIIGVEEPLEIGVTSGRFNDEYSWEMEITEVEIEPAEPALSDSTPPAATEQSTEPVGPDIAENREARLAATDAASFTNVEVPVDIFRVDLRIQWGEDNPRQIAFSTLRSLTPGPDIP